MVDLTTILEKIIHSNIRKKEINDTMQRIINKMNNILDKKENNNTNSNNNNIINSNKYIDNNNGNNNYGSNVNKNYFNNDITLQGLKNEYYKLKGEIGFI